MRAVVAQPVRDRLDGPDVERDVLPDPAVAAGGGPDQPALLVGQVDGQPVDLQLGQPADRRAGVPGRALQPERQLVGGEHVVQAEQPFGVLDGGEPGGEAAADPLAGRIGRQQGRILRLQRLEFAQQRVELAVGHGRCVEHVVAELRVADPLGQLGVPPRRVLWDVDRRDAGQRGLDVLGSTSEDPVLLLTPTP